MISVKAMTGKHMKNCGLGILFVGLCALFGWFVFSGPIPNDTPVWIVVAGIIGIWTVMMLALATIGYALRG